MAQRSGGPGPPSPGRRWAVLVLVVLAAAAAAVAGTLVAAVQVGIGLDGAFLCGPEVSEGTMIAPASWRGQVLCTDGPDGPVRRDSLLFAALVGGSALAAVGLVAVWLRTRSSRLLEVGLLAVALLPTLLLVGVRVLPADCTDGQVDRHGAAGCERDIESR